jgi:hypothetical protein
MGAGQTGTPTFLSSSNWTVKFLKFCISTRTLPSIFRSSRKLAAQMPWKCGRGTGWPNLPPARRARAQRKVIGVERRWVGFDGLHLAVVHLNDDLGVTHVVHKRAGVIFPMAAIVASLSVADLNLLAQCLTSLGMAQPSRRR